MEDRYRSGAYAADHPDWHAEDAPEKARAVLRMMDSVGWRPARVLDVGCGSGTVLQALKDGFDSRQQHDVEFVGYDIAEAALARALDTDRLFFRVGDVLETTERADVVICLDVFEHVPDDLGFLQQLRAHGDRFVFRIPLDLSAMDVLRPDRMLAARRRYGHLHAYSHDTALALLAEAGFEVVADRYHRIKPAGRSLRQRGVDLARRGLFKLHPRRTVAWVGGWSLMVAAIPRADEPPAPP